MSAVYTSAQGKFRCRFHDDSMAPDHPNGVYVEFSRIDPSKKLQPLKDYFVQRHDGKAMFRRLYEVDGQMLYFIALRRPYGHDPVIPVKRADIRLLGVACAHWQPLEESNLEFPLVESGARNRATNRKSHNRAPRRRLRTLAA